jgi:hypothetical protein
MMIATCLPGGAKLSAPGVIMQVKVFFLMEEVEQPGAGV